MTEPCALSFAIFIAYSAASTRFVKPPPIPTAAPSFTRTIALLLVIAAVFQAKMMSSQSSGRGVPCHWSRGFLRKRGEFVSSMSQPQRLADIWNLGA